MKIDPYEEKCHTKMSMTKRAVYHVHTTVERRQQGSDRRRVWNEQVGQKHLERRRQHYKDQALIKSVHTKLIL